MMIRLFQLLLCLFMFSAAAPARCKGTFSIANHPSPPSLDNYTSRLTPERSDPDARIRVFLHVSSSFDIRHLSQPECQILRHETTEIFISCPSVLVETIAALPGVESCSVSLNVQPLLDSARSQSGCDAVHGIVSSQLTSAYTGKGVLTGILDTEFDTRHPAFLDRNGKTRFIALWDQHDSTGAKKNRFGYGTIKKQDELFTDSTFGLDTHSHGTHTSSCMAGSDWESGYVGFAPDATLIAVRYGGTQEIADGLRWICSIADSLGISCVINLSLGVAFGPHDGTSKIDRVIDSLSGPGKIIVGAMGNDGAKTSHIRFNFQPGDSGSTWILPYIDSLSSDTFSAFTAADFWGEPGKHFTAEFFILNQPTGEYLQSNNSISTTRSRTSEIDSIFWNDAVSGKTPLLMQCNVERSSESNSKPHLTVYARTLDKNLVLGIRIINSGTTETVIHGWNINREAVHSLGIPGFSIGDTLFTVNEIGGTAHRSITVGGYISRVSIPMWTGTPSYHEWLTLGDAFYSSSIGPTVDGRIKPDITAPAWSVVAAISRAVPRDFGDIVLWPDTSTTFSRYAGHTGTSMSSPIVAGIVALMLEAAPDLTPEDAKIILHETAIKDNFTGPLPSLSNKWGAGKVNAYGAVTRLLGIPVKNTYSKSATKFTKIRNSGRTLFLSSLPNEAKDISLVNILGRSVYSCRRIRSSIIMLPESVADGFYIVKITIRENDICLETPVIINQ
jgi:subtilisin family serine protease